MALIKFDEWAPDRASLATGALRAQNVLPVADGFQTSPGFAEDGRYPVLPTAGSNKMALQAFQISDGSTVTILFCRTNVFMLTGATWTDITRDNGSGTKIPYTTDPEGRWSWQKWGDLLYFTNYSDALQKFDMHGGVKATDVIGDLPNGIRARFNIIIRDFHVLFDTNDNTGSSPTPFRMHWSGRLRPDTYLPSLVTGAGYKDIISVGRLRAAIGGDFGFILGSKGTARIDAIGPPLQFQVSNLDEDVGCLYPQSVIKVGGAIFWYSPIGWRKSTGGPSEAIGQERVDKHFRRRVQENSIFRMSSAILKDKPVIMFSYVSVDSTDGYPDEVLFYNYESNRWTEGQLRCLFLGTMAPAPALLDDLILGEVLIDSDDTLIDTEESQTGLTCIVTLNSPRTLATIIPSIDRSLIVSKEIQLIPGRRAQVKRVRLIAEGDSTSYRVRVSSRDRQPSIGVTNDPWIRPERSGSCGANKRGRYHRFELELTGYYDNIMGLEVDVSPAGDK